MDNCCMVGGCIGGFLYNWELKGFIVVWLGVEVGVVWVGIVLMGVVWLGAGCVCYMAGG